MVNIDRVNNDLGYTTGDIVLKAVARLIAQAAQDAHIFGRVVGDEFVVVMPDSTIRNAEALPATVHEAIESFHMDLGRRGTINYLACRIDTAVFATGGPGPEALIATARIKIS